MYKMIERLRCDWDDEMVFNRYYDICHRFMTGAISLFPPCILLLVRLPHQTKCLVWPRKIARCIFQIGIRIKALNNWTLRLNIMADNQYIMRHIIYKTTWTLNMNMNINCSIIISIIIMLVWCWHYTPHRVNTQFNTNRNDCIYINIIPNTCTLLSNQLLSRVKYTHSQSYREVFVRLNLRWSTKFSPNLRFTLIYTYNIQIHLWNIAGYITLKQNIITYF